jgi:hypothetical protein
VSSEKSLKEIESKNGAQTITLNIVQTDSKKIVTLEIISRDVRGDILRGLGEENRRWQKPSRPESPGGQND